MGSGRTPSLQIRTTADVEPPTFAISRRRPGTRPWPIPERGEHGGPQMNTDVVAAVMIPTRPAWGSLLWLIPLTVLWIVLIYWQPFIPASGVPPSALQLMAHGFIAVGLWLGLESTDLTPSQRRTTWLAVMIPDTLWFAVAWSGAINGVFITGPSSFPWLPLAIFLPVLLGAPLLLLSK